MNRLLDLRNNPGGFLEQAIHVAETFLPAGQLILTQKGRNGMNDHNGDSRNRIRIERRWSSLTISRPRLQSCRRAMQDHDRALIVGQTSFGKGLRKHHPAGGRC
jgi:carboxyl-terminal processing protease